MSETYSIKLELSLDEKQKLEKLAAARNMSCDDVLRHFIAASQPGGSGWKPPYIKPKAQTLDKGKEP